MADLPDTVISHPGLQNASAWYNLTSWTVNVTRYAPSLEDLMLAAPRMFMKLGSFVPPYDQLGPDGSPDSLSAASALDANHPAGTAPALYNFMDPTATNNPGAIGAAPDTPVTVSGLSVDTGRGLGSVFSYATSKWALACIAMAVILNRTYIYAATRRRLRLRWTVRLLLRFLPIIIISMHAVRLLQSLQCQTSPDFALLRWGDSTKSSDLMFLHQNSFFNALGRIILGSTDEQSCLAVRMIPAEDDEESMRLLRGSLSRLWPLFSSFCLSHFLETLSCAVQGRPHAYETAMTLFEQSLAFAEADAAVSSQISWGISTKSSSTTVKGFPMTITRSMIMRRVNTPPEVLYVGLISAMTHISSHILGVFDLQAKYRLVNTGFWAFAFMAPIVWSAVTFDLEDSSAQGLLRYPTVCIIGIVPHVLVLVGIAMCMFVYVSGVLLSAMSPSAEEERLRLTFHQRLSRAHHNMQANVSLSEIRITREMDVYTALLRAGFAAVTMASEAVYLNEDRGVSLSRHTWLEEARLKEVEELQRAWAGIGPATSRFDQIGAIGLVPVRESRSMATNGFSRERVAQAVPNARNERGLRVGVGATERSARWVMALELFLNITKLFMKLGAISLLWIMGVARIRSRPAWLLRLARRSKEDQDAAARASRAAASSVGGPSGSNGPPVMDTRDIEAEIRRTSQDQSEENIDANLYNYWLQGGWWGSDDSSGDFQPSRVEDDWDTTSIVSTTTDGQTDDESGWVSEEDGQRTPTQRSRRDSSEASDVDGPLSMSDLAKLLQPRSERDRQNSRVLAAHFQSEAIVTRSQFKRLEQLQRTRIITSAASDVPPLNQGRRNTKLTPDEEEQLLEQILLNRRQTSTEMNAQNAEQMDEGAPFGGNGPHCVVCQSEPRSIIVWPCRCLSLCDTCRVSLAMNNFDKCVCCRREVMSFSRIYVP